MTALAETSVLNEYSSMRIPEINHSGTDALHDCVVTELTQRGIWEDPEVQWALDYSMDLHQEERRKDGPYVNHILRCAIWGVREFEIDDPEVIKTIFLHDAVENQPSRLIAELGRGLLLGDGTERERGLQALAKSGKLSQMRTVTAIGNITCPSFKDCTGDVKARRYAQFIIGTTLPDPRAAVAKTADHLDNFNGNIYNPDPKLRRRLYMKYLPLSPAFQDAVQASPYIPERNKPFITNCLVNGEDRAKQELQKDSSVAPGLTVAELEELTLKQVLA